jgi:hypothetical protein
MPTRGRSLIGALLARAVRRGAIVASVVAYSAAPALSQTTPAPAPSSAPSPSPAAPGGPSDPCTSILALVNRPTVATGSCVFKNGRGDVEIGYNNAISTGAGGGATVSYPQTFIRAGTAIRNVEMEITPPSVVRTSAGSPLTGISDAALGAKWELGYTSKALASINAAATLPVGDPAFSARGSTYTANLNASYALNSEFGVSGTLGFESLAAPGASGSVVRTGLFVPALLVTAALPGTSQLYGEISNVNHIGVGQPGRTLYDFGAQKQLGAHIVVDVEAGFAPNPVAGQTLHYLGFGITYGNV